MGFQDLSLLVVHTTLFWGVLNSGDRLLAVDRLPSVSITGIPHVKQKPDFCGEACAEMWLKKRKATVDQDYVFDQSGLDPLLARGCYTKELATALRQMGFQVGAGLLDGSRGPS